MHTSFFSHLFSFILLLLLKCVTLWAVRGGASATNLPGCLEMHKGCHLPRDDWVF